MNANSVLHPCTRSDTPGEKLKEKQEGWKGRQRDDLSLPADAESAPWAPSQLPGQFTSCKMDWLSMDPCPCVAANCELIKEHFLWRNTEQQPSTFYLLLRKHAALNKRINLSPARHKLLQWFLFYFEIMNKYTSLKHIAIGKTFEQTGMTPITSVLSVCLCRCMQNAQGNL